MKQIPFNKPFVTDVEEEYMRDAIAKGKISGDGYYTQKVHHFIENVFSTKKALLTNSCSSALDIAGILLGLKEGDEVILPSFTFVSTANAVLLRGAKPVFADILETTLNIDPIDIERKITNRTKAIIPVHYAGVSCDMDAIVDIAEQHRVQVVEDAAQGVNAKYKEKYLGTIGDIGCYSFHDTKNYTCGEGGALLLNGKDELIEKAEIVREKGTNRSKFFRGEVDKYTWVDIGSSYLLSDMLAAFLYGQLQKLDEIQCRREKVYKYYYEKLKPLESKEKLRLPIIPPECTSNYHIFYILLKSEEERNYVMDKLKEKGIPALFHYLPLHTSPMGKKLGYHYGDLPITESLSGRLLRLPMHADLLREEIDYIIEAVYEIMDI